MICFHFKQCLMIFSPVGKIGRVKTTIMFSTRAALPLVVAFVLSLDVALAQQPPQFRTVRVGALFPEDEHQAVREAVFSYAVEMINADRSVLLKSRLIQKVETVRPHDSMKASRKICDMIQQSPGVAAIFGPTSSPALAGHIQGSVQ